MKAFFLLLVLSCLTLMRPESSEGSRILGIFPLHARSHFMMHEALMKGLARKGHQVDVISLYPQKKPYPNYTDIIELPLIMPGLINNMTYDYFIHAFNKNVQYTAATDFGNTVCNHLGHPEMLKLIRNPPKDPPYDLLIIEVLSAHCFFALRHHFNVPVIGVSSAALYPWQNGIIGNPANLAFVPNNLIDYYTPMTFLERMHNTVHAMYSDFIFQYYTIPQDEIIKKYLGVDAPGVRESERNLALVFVNSHPTLNGPRPVTPALVEVGGLHVQDDGAEVPRDLQEWMDNSTDGFIYFTFGSMVTIESFPEETIQVFYKSLAKIAPVRVLIKIPEPKKLPPGMPKNFRTFVWASQYKVLKHKNVKAFITHAGLMGGQEAIHCAVPMIALPLFADQFINAQLYTRKKIAVTLNYQGLTEAQMDDALNKILHDPVYKNTAAKVSQEFLDRPMSSMETATWWVEHVIRHGNSLRSPALDLAWWQVELLDVYGTLLLIAAITIFVAIALIKFLINLLFIVMRPKVTNSKKKN